MTAARNLRVVPSAPEPTPEESLADLVPKLAAAEAKVARLRGQAQEQTFALARKRGVAFIRFEHIRREFQHG
jgi:hypothetical protein